jgi:hypothetical protein
MRKDARSAKKRENQDGSALFGLAVIEGINHPNLQNQDQNEHVERNELGP